MHQSKISRQIRAFVVSLSTSLWCFLALLYPTSSKAVQLESHLDESGEYIQWEPVVGLLSEIEQWDQRLERLSNQPHPILQLCRVKTLPLIEMIKTIFDRTTCYDKKMAPSIQAYENFITKARELLHTDDDVFTSPVTEQIWENIDGKGTREIRLFLDSLTYLKEEAQLTASMTKRLKSSAATNRFCWQVLDSELAREKSQLLRTPPTSQDLTKLKEIVRLQGTIGFFSEGNYRRIDELYRASIGLNEYWTHVNWLAVKYLIEDIGSAHKFDLKSVLRNREHAIYHLERWQEQFHRIINGTRLMKTRLANVSYEQGDL